MVLAVSCSWLVNPTAYSLEGPPGLSTEAELALEVAEAPCADRKRLDSVRDLFQKMGAAAEDIAVHKQRRVSNLSVTLPGASPESEKIVIGAHYDKVIPGCGAVDNWSGIVILAHLYRALKEIPRAKTLVFVAFGREEQGLRGSKAMVQQLSEAEVANHCAMINLDSFGMSWPQVATNLSTDSLGELAADLAEQMNMQFSQQPVDGGSDSTSFLRRGIPAMTLHALGKDFDKIIHTHRDRANQVQPTSLYLGYRLALTLVLAVDQKPCGAWR
ncbi:MAG: Zn-dependent exopeptidase M28 [Deltaproteobacteria bacterium]|nr:Zn-dependent exopeptidase M28 [Deltaproteobacteria bacterium]